MSLILKLLQGKGKYFKIFGLAKRLQNNEIFFVYIKGEIKGHIIVEYKNIQKEKCLKNRKQKFVCKKYNVDVQRPPTSNELHIMAHTFESKFFELVEKN